MRITYLLLLAWMLTGTSCERKLSRAEVKDNLEKTMNDYLRDEQGSGAMNFQMVDVDYFEEPAYYECEFKVKLHRPDGSDTTGIIKGRITRDFSKVTKK